MNVYTWYVLGLNLCSSDDFKLAYEVCLQTHLCASTPSHVSSPALVASAHRRVPADSTGRIYKTLGKWKATGYDKKTLGIVIFCYYSLNERDLFCQQGFQAAVSVQVLPLQMRRCIIILLSVLNLQLKKKPQMVSQLLQAQKEPRQFVRRHCCESHWPLETFHKLGTQSSRRAGRMRSTFGLQDSHHSSCVSHASLLQAPASYLFSRQKKKAWRDGGGA